MRGDVVRTLAAALVLALVYLAPSSETGVAGQADALEDAADTIMANTADDDAFVNAVADTPEIEDPLMGTEIGEGDSLDAAREKRVQRHQERIASARWWLIAAGDDALYMVDKHTLIGGATAREGWVQIIFFKSPNNTRRILYRARWDCTRRTSSTLSTLRYDLTGKPTPAISATFPKTEPIVPETIGEALYFFVCGGGDPEDLLPMPVDRDPVGAALTFGAYKDAGGFWILGLQLATLNPVSDRLEIEDLILTVSEAKQANLRRAIGILGR